MQSYDPSYSHPLDPSCWRGVLAWSVYLPCTHATRQCAAKRGRMKTCLHVRLGRVASPRVSEPLRRSISTSIRKPHLLGAIDDSDHDIDAKDKCGESCLRLTKHRRLRWRAICDTPARGSITTRTVSTQSVLWSPRIKVAPWRGLNHLPETTTGSILNPKQTADYPHSCFTPLRLRQPEAWLKSRINVNVLLIRSKWCFVRL